MYEVHKGEFYAEGKLMDYDYVCLLLNKYHESVNDYEVLIDEYEEMNFNLKKELEEVNDKKLVYADLVIVLAKKLGFKSPNEFFDAIDEGFLLEG